LANIYKICAYVVDSAGDYKDDDDIFESLIDNTDLYCPVPVEYEMVNFEWSDDLSVNFSNCNKEDCEKYFNSIEEVDRNNE